MKFQLMSIAVAMAFAVGAQAQNTSAREVKNADQARIKAEYKAARERCDDKTGNAKDVCRKDAKASYQRAKADLKRADSKPAAPSAGAGSTK
jgi:hypothetical protein